MFDKTYVSPKHSYEPTILQVKYKFKKGKIRSSGDDNK